MTCEQMNLSRGRLYNFYNWSGWLELIWPPVPRRGDNPIQAEIFKRPNLVSTSGKQNVFLSKWVEGAYYFWGFFFLTKEGNEGCCPSYISITTVFNTRLLPCALICAFQNTGTRRATCWSFSLHTFLLLELTASTTYSPWLSGTYERPGSVLGAVNGQGLCLLGAPVK